MHPFIRSRLFFHREPIFLSPKEGMGCTPRGAGLAQGKGNLPPKGLRALQLELGRVGRVRRVGLFSSSGIGMGEVCMRQGDVIGLWNWHGLGTWHCIGRPFA